MDTLIMALGVLAGACILAGLCLTDWGIGAKQVSELSEQVHLTGDYLKAYHHLIESVEYEWQERQEEEQA